MNAARLLSINYGFYNATRMLIGVYHAVFLISTGVSLSQLAMLQVVFSVTMLLLDFPLAVVADRYHRKYSVIVGVFFTLLFYPLCLRSPDIPSLILSEIFYGIGICCISGAIEGWVLHSLEDKKTFSGYAHLASRVASLGSIITGITGIGLAYLYQSYLSGYWLSLVLMTVILTLFFLIKENKNSVTSIPASQSGNVLSYAVKSIHLLFTSFSGMYYLLIVCLFTFGIQILYHFWQPIMLSGTVIDKLTTTQLIVLLTCHIGVFTAQYIVNALLPKFDIASRAYRLISLLCALSGGLLCLVLLLVVTHYPIVSIVIFSLIHGVTSVIPLSAQNRYLCYLSDEDSIHVSGITGAISLISRLSAITALLIVSALPADFAIHYYLSIPAGAFLLCSVVIARWLIPPENRQEARDKERPSLINLH